MHRPPFLLLRTDWRSPTFSLNFEITSLVAPQISKRFTDPSSNSLTHFSCWWRERVCWVDGKLRSSSMQLYNSSSPDRPLEIFTNADVDDASNVLSLLSSSWILRVAGWDLEGRLIDLIWHRLAIVLLFSLKAQIWDGCYNVHDYLYISAHRLNATRGIMDCPCQCM